LGGGITHIGLVVDRKSEDGIRNLIVHNIGGGQVLADCLFEFKIIGHYYYEKKSKSRIMKKIHNSKKIQFILKKNRSRRSDKYCDFTNFYLILKYHSRKKQFCI